ncbi:hypothetical protein VTN02DRAFT_6852 [Thermoascus thermophilus]
MANDGAQTQQRDSVPESIHGGSIDGAGSGPPKPTRYASTPSYESPWRHHRRNPTAPHRVKETLNARSEYTTSQDDGTAEHRINQYLIKQEIGRGSFGAVHLAVDQYGQEYAVKEFSKSRLRKRAQSHVLRRPRRPRRPGEDFNSPLHRHPSGTEDEQSKHPLYLIREEIAIMKKLNHNNLVSLIEVLDDPTEDSLYMVMEMCKKGVIMKVGLEERADPYDDGSCRCWFRDLILAIEYLHAQGIVHRDIKPDNCLLTSDDVLKVVDFGVSEMFEKNSDMYTAKSVGSPAFLPPELCVVKHGDVSGKAADIWSMGVTLYCLRYGRLPFEKPSIFELYEAIKNDEVSLEGETDENFKDLMSRILEKDPAKRITMRELREHPWVTKNGTDPLLSEEENTAEMLEPPTEEEMNTAITSNMGNLLAVMKAVQKFKRLVNPGKDMPMQSILGQEHESHFVQPPLEMDPEESISPPTKSYSLHIYNRAHRERDLVVKGYHPQGGIRLEASPERKNSASISSKHDSERSSVRPLSDRGSLVKDSAGSSIGGESMRADPADDGRSISTSRVPSRADTPTTKHSTEGTRGHARDPLEEEHPYLFIGPSTYTGDPTDDPGSFTHEGLFSEPDTSMTGILEFPNTMPPIDMSAVPIVSESPGASEIDIYETAYREEIERIRKRSMARQPKLYLTRRVEGKNVDLGDAAMLINDESHQAQSALRIGEKVAVPSAGAAASAMTALLHAQQQEQAQESDATTEAQSQQQPPTAASEPTAVSTSSSDMNPAPPTSPSKSKTRLRSLLGRMRGSRSSISSSDGDNLKDKNKDHAQSTS